MSFVNFSVAILGSVFGAEKGANFGPLFLVRFLVFCRGLHSGATDGPKMGVSFWPLFWGQKQTPVLPRIFLAATSRNLLPRCKTPSRFGARIDLGCGAQRHPQLVSAAPHYARGRYARAGGVQMTFTMRDVSHEGYQHSSSAPELSSVLMRKPTRTVGALARHTFPWAFTVVCIAERPTLDARPTSRSVAMASTPLEIGGRTLPSYICVRWCSHACVIVARWCSHACAIVARWSSHACVIVARWCSHACAIIARWCSHACFIVARWRSHACVIVARWYSHACVIVARW